MYFKYIRVIFILLEIIIVIFLGFLPEDAPYQISQIVINFICSMQYNTFQKTKKIPMATTFCTNHLRQSGKAFVNYLRNSENMDVYSYENVRNVCFRWNNFNNTLSFVFRESDIIYINSTFYNIDTSH